MALVTLTAGNDNYTNGSQGDTIEGLGGDDTIDGGNGADSILGGLGNDSLIGNNGNDTVHGDDGNDTVIGTGNGTDFFHGDAGTDTLDYSGVTNALTVTFSAAGAGTVVQSAAVKTDTFTTFERLLLGSNADSLTGSAGSEWVQGGGGADTINGLGGNDELGGGDGADRIDAGDGDDFAADGTGADSLVGGLGNDVLFGTIDGAVDTLVGGSGTDAVDYRFNAAGLNITLTAIGTGTVTSGAEVDTFSGMEIYRLGAGNDTFVGSSGDDTVQGHTGNDNLSGGDGNDTFIVGYGEGTDTIAGGLGTLDTIAARSAGTTIYMANVSGIEVFNGGAWANFRLVGSTGGDVIDLSGATLTNVERIDGAAGNDTITGNGADNRIFGGLGDDSLVGGGGNDTFFLQSGSGVDTIDGGAGTADAIVAQSNRTYVNWGGIAGIEVFNGAGFADFRIVGTAAPDTMDLSGATLTNVERIDGGAGDDTITGNSADNRIFGGTGNDSLLGGDGNDTFLMQYDSALDVISGGNGTADTILAVGPGARIDWTKVSLVEFVNGGGFSNVQLIGTDSGDTLDFTGIGLTGIYLIDGGLGSDTITGSAVADRIIGRNGADVLSGAAGSDIFYYTSFLQSTVATADTIMDFAAGDKIDFLTFDSNTGVAGHQAFQWVDAAAFTAAGQLRAYADGLGHTIIEGNVNGDLAADFKIVLDNGYGIAFGDFMGVVL